MTSNHQTPWDALRETPLVFVVAGEPSGDALGASLMTALKDLTGGKIRFAGVGGEKMAAQGLESLFPVSDLAVMGIVEVVPQIPKVLSRLRKTVRAVKRLKPHAIVTIDAPGFSFRLMKRLKKNKATRAIPRIHYVAPSVWAWRPGRARKVARFLDHLLALLPFEPPYFEKEGLACSFVGHPVLEGGSDGGKPGGGRGEEGAAFRTRHVIPPDAPLVCVLPGSRRSETSRLLPVFAETLKKLAKELPGLRVVVPTVETVADSVREEAGKWPFPVEVLEGEMEKKGAFSAADVALAASGTVSLELALAGLPMVIAYRMNPISGVIARRLVKLDYASLVNIVLEEEAVPEFLLEDCRSERIAAALLVLLKDGEVRDRQIAKCQEALKRLSVEGERPSRKAARVILEVISDHYSQ